MAGVTLNPIPGPGTDLEHYVAALFQASGHYVEKSVIHRDPPAELLELDIVATDYFVDPVRSTLVEAKGGKQWGYPDLFKMLGWMRYLNDMSHATMFVSVCTDQHIAVMNKNLQQHGI